jgi:hypothetical protein
VAPDALARKPYGWSRFCEGVFMIKGLRSRRVAAVVAVVTLLIAVVVYAFLLLTRGDLESAYPAQPENVAYFDEAVIFDDLGVMTASSDLVLQGTVVDATPGVTHDFPDEAGGPETDRNIQLRVDRVVYNRHEIQVPDRIAVIEGWWAEGEGYAREGMPWSTVGDKGFFYLAAEDSDDPRGPYSYVSSSARITTNGTDVKPSGDRGAGPWASIGAGSQTASVELMVRQAAAAARAGRVMPAPEPRLSDMTETEQ